MEEPNKAIALGSMYTLRGCEKTSQPILIILKNYAILKFFNVMDMLIFIVYSVIGLFLTLYWWNRDYKESYEKAKASEEGVEKGTAEILLCFLFTFWPFVLLYKLVKIICRYFKLLRT